MIHRGLEYCEPLSKLLKARWIVKWYKQCLLLKCKDNDVLGTDWLPGKRILVNSNLEQHGGLMTRKDGMIKQMISLANLGLFRGL